MCRLSILLTGTPRQELQTWDWADLLSGLCSSTGTSRPRARFIETEVLDLSTKLLPRNPQQPSCGRLVVLGMFERSHDVLTFHLGQTRPLLIFLSHIQPPYTQPRLRPENLLSKIWVPPSIFTILCYDSVIGNSDASRWMHPAARYRSH